MKVHILPSHLLLKNPLVVTNVSLALVCSADVIVMVLSEGYFLEGEGWMRDNKFAWLTCIWFAADERVHFPFDSSDVYFCISFVLRLPVTHHFFITFFILFFSVLLLLILPLLLLLFCCVSLSKLSWVML